MPLVGRMLLIPQVVVTSKVSGRKWTTPQGTFGWIAWASRNQQTRTYGEVDARGVQNYTPGRIIFAEAQTADEGSLAIALDALTGLMGVADDFWWERLTAVPIPPDLLPAEVLYAEDMAVIFESEAPSLMGGTMSGTDGIFVGDQVPEWALDRLSLALAEPVEILAALIYLSESRNQFHFIGGDIGMVQKEPNAVPRSPIDTIRMETAFHNAYKAVEAILGGEPPKLERTLRQRLASRGIDPNAIAGFDGLREAMLDRVVRLQATRDKRSAHGGRTGVASRAITYFELMDAQYCAAYAIRRRIEGLRPPSTP